MPYCLLRSFTLTIIYIFTLFQVASAGDEVLSNGMDVSQFVANQIADNDIMVFAKTYCPYCKAAKNTFKSLLAELGFDDEDLSYKVIELDEQPSDDGELIQQELYEVTGQRTVPNVFIRGMHIGGNSDVQELLKDQQLASMIHLYN